MGIPEDAFVVLSVAAIKKVHKRIDYLINETDILGSRLGLIDMTKEGELAKTIEKYMDETYRKKSP